MSQNEAKYEEEFQPLQANEGRRGSHASPAAWCKHFEATMVEEVRGMRPRHAAQIVEIMQKVVGELQTGAVCLLVPTHQWQAMDQARREEEATEMEEQQKIKRN